MRRRQIAIIFGSMLLAAAASAASVRLEGPAVLPASGTVFGASLVIESASPVGAYSCTVTYPAELLEVLGVIAGDSAEFAEPLTVNNTTPGVLRFNDVQAVSLTEPVGEIHVANIRFSVLDSASDAVLDVTLSTLADTSGAALAVVPARLILRRPQIVLTLDEAYVFFGQSVTGMLELVSEATSADITLHLRSPLGEDQSQPGIYAAPGPWTVEIPGTAFDVAGDWQLWATWDPEPESGGALLRSETATVTVSRIPIALTMTADSPQLLGASPRVSGVLRASDIPVDPTWLTSQPIIVTATSVASGAVQSGSLLTFLLDETARFEGRPVGLVLNETGYWDIRAGFAGDPRLLSGRTGTHRVEVEDTIDHLGYGLLVVGNDFRSAGLPGHMNSMNVVFSAFRKRQIPLDGVYYLSQADISLAPADLEPGRFRKTTEANIAESLLSLAYRMNRRPGPLVMVLTNHGEQGKFHMAQPRSGKSADKPRIDEDGDILEPGEIAEMLNDFADALYVQSAQQQTIVLVIGACHSGSFIHPIRDGYRGANPLIIVTSCDINEKSYGGECYQGRCLQELFIAKLFDGLGNGQTLLTAFEQAASIVKSIAPETASPIWNGGTRDYADNRVQHALLDDNSDGVGAHSGLSALSGFDGALSAGFLLGIAQNPPSFGIVSQSPGPQIRAGDIPSVTAEISETGALAWLEFYEPNYTGPPVAATETLQPLIHGVSVAGKAMPGAPRQFFWSPSDLAGYFDMPGAYESRIFAQSTNSGESAAGLPFFIHVLDGISEPPSQSALLSPLPGERVDKPILFQWEPSTHPGGPVHYEIVIASNPSLYQPLIKRNHLVEPFLFLEEDSVLLNGATYYWTVRAHFAGGGVSPAGEIRSLVVEESSGPLQIFRGVALDALTGDAIGPVEVQANRPIGDVMSGPVTFGFRAEAGEYRLTLRKEGYCSRETEVRVSLDSVQASGFLMRPEHVDATQLPRLLDNAHRLHGVAAFQFVDHWLSPCEPHPPAAP